MKLIALNKLYMNNERGYSLLEIMLSLSLGLMLIAVVVQIFLSIKDSDNTIQDELYLQTNMKLAIQTLTNQIRIAGFQNYPKENLPLSEAIMIKKSRDGKDSMTINRDVKIEIKTSPYPVGQSKYSLYEGYEMIQGLDGLQACFIKNQKGNPVAITILLHMTAPFGMTMSQVIVIAFREYLS